MTDVLPLPRQAGALLFDLGRVVLDIDFNRTLHHWARLSGCEPMKLGQCFLRDELYHRHEKGEVSDEIFFAALRSSLGVELTDAQLIEGWNAIFVGEMPGIDRLLARAAEHLPIYAFSNTNALHGAYFSNRYAELLSHFRQIFLSSTIGLRKPDADAYDHVVREIGVPAERIVFFDDLDENIRGARARGLNAVRVTSSDDVARALAALGI